MDKLCVMCMEILTLKYEINDIHHSSFISPVKNKNAYKINNIHSKKYLCKRLYGILENKLYIPLIPAMIFVSQI